MQVAIELPNDFVVFQGEKAIKEDIRLSYALWLFQSARVTISKAAELAGMDIYDFMSACKSNRISVINVDKSELRAEMQHGQA